MIVCTWNKNVLNAERNNKWKASSKNEEKKFDSFKASNTIWKSYAIHLRVPCEAHRISFIIFEMPSIFSIVARFFSTFLPVNVSLTLFNFIWVLSKSDLFGWSVFNYGLIEVNRKLHTHWGGRSKHMCHMRIFGAVYVCIGSLVCFTPIFYSKYSIESSNLILDVRSIVAVSIRMTLKFHFSIELSKRR